MDEYSQNNAMDDLNNKYLTFFIGGNTYAIELSHVTEIIGVQATTPVPNVPAYIMGMINLRGKIVPVIDGRKKLSYPDKETDDKTCTVIVEHENAQIGLLVDCVSEVASVEDGSIAEPPSVGKDGRDKYLKGVLKIGEEVILSIDCAAFFAHDRA
ncbi:MAG: chemotaxis protein CheW [Oscillospiraceae bacterium]